MQHIFRVCYSSNNPYVVRTISGIKNVRYHQQCGEQGSLSFGNAYASSIEVEYYTESQPDLKVGDLIEYVQHYDYSLADFETPNPVSLVVNYFWVASFTKGSKTSTFIAYDAITKLNVDYSQRLLANKANFPMTVQDLVDDIKTFVGLDNIVFVSYPTELQQAVLQYFYVEGITARDILRQIAELCGVNLFGYSQNAGGNHLAVYIYGYPYSSTIMNISGVRTDSYVVCPTDQVDYYVGGVKKTPVFYKESGLDVGANDSSAIDKVIARSANGDVITYYPEIGTDDNVYEIKNNIIIQNVVSFGANQPYNSIKGVYVALNAVCTMPIVTAKLFTFRFPFVARAIVYFVDKDNTIKQFPIMNLDWTNESVVVESYGFSANNQIENDWTSIEDQSISTIAKLNELMGSLTDAVGDISDAYDNTATYAVNDLCIYNNVLYRCITAVSVAEDFDPSKWVATTLSDEKVSKTGDTMTGTLVIEGATTEELQIVHSATAKGDAENSYKRVIFQDENLDTVAILSGDILDTGATRARLQASGVSSNNYLQLLAESDGTRTVVVNAPEAWRSALGLGTSGAFPITIAQGGTGATDASNALGNLSGERRYLINNGSGITTSVKRRLSFSGAVYGLMYVSGNSSARCGLYVIHCSASTAIVEPVKAATACTITTGTGYFDITSSSGSIYATILTAQSLSRISESAAT